MWVSSLSGVGLVWLKPTPEARSHQHADSDRLPSVTRGSSSTKEVFVQVITVKSDAFRNRASPACCFLYCFALKSSSCPCLDACLLCVDTSQKMFLSGRKECMDAE